MAGAGPEVGQGIGPVGDRGAALIDVQPEHRQEVPRRADPGGILQRPEEGLDLPVPAPFLHAGIVVLRIGSGQDGIQIGLVENLRIGGRIIAGLLPIERRGQRPGPLDAKLLEPGPLGTIPFDPALPARGTAQDLASLGRIGMMASEVVLAGGVTLVGPLGIEDARRRHQEDAEERVTHHLPNQVHGGAPE